MLGVFKGVKKMKHVASLVLIVSIGYAFPSWASNSLEKEEHLLDGTSFTFQYQNAGAMDVSFADGTLTYKWVAGRNVDEPQQSYTYKSRKLDADIYLVNWHEPEKKNYVTMVYNFKSNTCAVSVISRYGNEKPFTGFQAGVIEHVNKR